MIKAILFDFMGVLLFTKDSYNPDPVIDSIDSVIGKVVNDEKFKTEILTEYGVDEKQFDQILKKIVNKYERFQALWDMLPELHKKYKLAIINNGTAFTLPLLKSIHKVDDNFDLFISSAIEGVSKPDPKIFLLTAQRLGVNPKECLFMDDSQKNVEGAKALGMETIWWKNREQGLRDLVTYTM